MRRRFGQRRGRYYRHLGAATVEEPSPQPSPLEYMGRGEQRRTNTLDRTLLYLAYFFPPRGGAGVQRSIKFAKYLPRFGWKHLVVAHGGMADNATGVTDPTLLNDLPA